MVAIGLTNPLEYWDRSTGYDKLDIAEPVLDEKSDPEDAEAVIVKVLGAGFCGTDRSIWHRKSLREQILNSMKSSVETDRVAGHELIGEVVELGRLARHQSNLALGDTVASESHIYCGHCRACQRMESHVCYNEKIVGITAQGCFAAYVKLPWKVLWKTDTKRIRPAVAAIMEPFGNAVHVCESARLGAATVLVNGCGAIGLMSIAVAHALGASLIIGIDPDPRRRLMAKAMGAAHVFASAEGAEQNNELITTIMDLTQGHGVDVAMEMSGAPSGFQTVCGLTCRGGAIILFGLRNGGWMWTDPQKFILSGQSIHGVVGRRVFKTWLSAQRILESNLGGVQEKIYDVVLNKGEGSIVPLQAFQKDTFEKCMDDYPKLVFSVDQSFFEKRGHQ